ncbi:hypothetical protein V9K67_04920 [Paraflavisolibacter sp. H34]|uniref:hypothetical protein n=1 Tax=Huijunlia imazamoxiresistens TaxID=3127457 RepID=UPI003015EB7F
MSVFPVYLVWDDIDFSHDSIKVKPARIRRILKPIPYKGSLPCLNEIKEEYFVRQYNKPFKLVFSDSAFSPADSPAWEQINGLIERAIEIHRFPGLPKIVKPRPRAAKPAPRLAAAPREDNGKADYLKLLAARQSEAYRLITIREKYSGKTESSFLFRLHTLSGRILIVWENTNPARATYLFIADQQNLNERLVKIEAFIHSENVDFKRSRFQQLAVNKQLRRELFFIGSLRHEGLRQFETDLQTFINRY